MKAKILIVEDESLVAADLEDRLTRLGYAVTGIADNATDALRVARENLPDLALMDIHIIGPMDGIQTAGELRDQLRVPVVFLTSHADRGTLERACATEPFGYVVKPFEEHDLTATIETAFYRYQAEERLRKMERWLATTLRSIGDAVIATDLSGRITFVNPTAESLTGWKLQDALGRAFSEVFRVFKGPDRRPMNDVAQRAIHSGIGFELDEDVVLLARNGRETPIDDSTAPIRDDAGQITGAIVVFRDKTGRLQLEAERRQLEEKMREAQKLESLGLMAGGIAHDFNNLLTAVMGHVNILEHALPDHFSQRDSLRQIHNASERGAALCRQMLAYAGKSFRSTVDFDLGRLTEDITDLLHVSLSKTAKLELNVAPDLPSVCGDPSQIQQVIMNFVINASDALDDKPGQIRVTVGTMRVTRHLLSTAAVAGAECKEGEYVFMEVADTGCGMSRETLTRIFDPFFSTKFVGRGLGLAAVSGIVRAHKGILTVESTLGAGSSFRLMLAPNLTGK
jgi:hypothetical protein